MLKLKPEGDPVEYGNVKRFEGVDGPPQAYAETRGGKRYIYSTYALAVKDVDRTTAEIGLWAAIRDTLNALLYNGPDSVHSIKDPIILWRKRPAFSEEDGKFYISMRCVIVPRDEEFLPAKPLRVV